MIKICVNGKDIQAEDGITVAKLIADLKARGIRGSKATVYRTLPILIESNLLREVDIGLGEKFYRPATAGVAPAGRRTRCGSATARASRRAYSVWYAAKARAITSRHRGARSAGTPSSSAAGRFSGARVM